MVDRVKGGGRAPPRPSPGWAEFTIMVECTLESAIPSLFELSRLWHLLRYFALICSWISLYVLLFMNLDPPLFLT
jgi:hypothetical protein